MATTKCPHCGKQIEISEALKHEVEENVKAAAVQEALKEAQKKADEKFESELKRFQKEANEERERNQKLLKQLEDLNDQLRQLRRKDEERDLEMKKRLAVEEEKIREESLKKAAAEQELKFAEYQKKIADMERSLAEAQRKAQQGSQQTQGEVLELELEDFLKKEFPNDTISEVPKGIRGADVVQEVRDKVGRICGKILWESKNAKWSDSWIAKLREDQRAAKADVAILISKNLPNDIENFAVKKGIWITNRESILGLTSAIRLQLYKVFITKKGAEGKNEKVEMLYKYFTSHEFTQRVEAIVESFATMKEEIEIERRWFTRKWERQEKAIRKALDQTSGMYGSLQEVVGPNLPEIKSLELPGKQTMLK